VSLIHCCDFDELKLSEGSHGSFAFTEHISVFHKIGRRLFDVLTLVFCCSLQICLSASVRKVLTLQHPLLINGLMISFSVVSRYESGGAMFPSALQRTLFGLVCGQLTLIGYLITRGFYSQPIFLLPLPLATIWGMSYFDQVRSSYQSCVLSKCRLCFLIIIVPFDRNSILLVSTTVVETSRIHWF
jgi:hypothetical protein